MTILDAVTPTSEGRNDGGTSPPEGRGTTRESTADAIAVDDRYAAHNYSPLPIVAASAEGAWITDIEGRRYLACEAA